MNGVLWFLVFFIPAYISNMAPVFVRKLHFLEYPLDCGIKLGGKPLLGKNKTWRGLFFGTVLGGVAGWIMQAAGLPFIWWHGFVLGFAALFGDAAKSFFKRRLGVRPGGRWMPWDQLDFNIAAYLASLFFVQFPLVDVVLGFAIIFVGDIIIQLIGGWTKLKADSL
jgi:CDP-2,3-bis-(O-geranylgeranyl)-sn-glycerol synthase